MTAYRFEGPGQKAIEHLLSVPPLCNAPDAALVWDYFNTVGPPVTTVWPNDDWNWSRGERALFDTVFPLIAALSERTWDDDLARNITTALSLAAGDLREREGKAS